MICLKIDNFDPFSLDSGEGCQDDNDVIKWSNNRNGSARIYTCGVRTKKDEKAESPLMTVRKSFLYQVYWKQTAVWCRLK